MQQLIRSLKLNTWHPGLSIELPEGDCSEVKRDECSPPHIAIRPANP